MTSVESAVPVKTPEPDQYWEHVKSKDRVYFIGRNPEGEMVWQCEGDTVEVGNLDWSDWQHIPDCDGWDWEHPQEFPKYYTTVNDSRHYYRCDSADEVWAVTENGEERQGSPAYILLDTQVWKEVTEAEAKARVKPAEQWPKYVVNPDESCRWYIKLISENSAQHVSSTGIESPERWGVLQTSLVKDGQWVEVTEAEAFARVVKPTEHDSDPPPFAKPFTSARSGMGIRKDAVAWRPNGQRHEVATDVTYQAETRVESPDEWVIQDRVTARTGIDRGWWGTTLCPEHDKWWIVCDNGSASGNKHGYVNSDGIALNLICRRKDLPPVPAPIEETFPQWYILKESEVLQAFTPWAIKRTGEETCIRYVRYGGRDVSASNEVWTGGTDAWRKCHSSEAFQRLGILGEAYLPAVPADKRRVPIKAWVTYRLADEGGDWPVRATPADQTYQNWKEIKFDSNGMFIEVDQ